MFDFGVYLLHKYARFNRGTRRRVRDGTVSLEVRVGRFIVSPLFARKPHDIAVWFVRFTMILGENKNVVIENVLLLVAL
jgi:hypothetical protein